MIQNGRQNGAAASNGERLLDSWKEIASYLDRSVRTVQTWEKEEGLPVHRHLHRRAGTVCAYPSEVDAWREGRSLPNGNGTGVTEWLRRRPWLIGVAGATAVVGVLLGWWMLNGVSANGSPPTKSPITSEERDWLLIANFDNQTGEEIFDGALEAALHRELANTRFAKVAPMERVGDALRLMRRPPDTPVDATLAREVARRDGGIRAVLIGRVEEFAPNYLLSVDLLNTEGVALFSLSEVAEGLDSVLPAVSSLSIRVRKSLGETLPTIELNGDSMSPVSTPSLQALSLYSQADQLLREMSIQGTQTAEELLRDAILEDPEFASSYTLLAWCLWRQNRPASEYLELAEKAVELSDRATLAERYFIRGSQYHMRWMTSPTDSDLKAALAQYRALLQLDPAHFWARNNATHLSGDSGHMREALAILLRSLAARPNDASVVAEVALMVVANEGDLKQAQSHVQRARRLQRDLGIDAGDFEGFLEFYPVHELWVQGDAESVVHEVGTIVDSLAASAPTVRHSLAFEAIGYYLDLGMFQNADQLQATYGIFSADRWAGVVENRDVRGRGQLTLEQIRSRRNTTDWYRIADNAWDLARYGFAVEAEQHLEMLPDDLPQGAKAEALAARGTLDLAEGRYQEAILALENSIELYGDRYPLTGYFRVARVLSQAWVKQGQTDEAVRVLEEASRQKARVFLRRIPWMKVQLELADLYRDLGRETEAREIDNELRSLCAWADPDFEILQELRNRA